jgi:hypothetical protein
MPERMTIEQVAAGIIPDYLGPLTPTQQSQRRLIVGAIKDAQAWAFEQVLLLTWMETNKAATTVYFNKDGSVSINHHAIEDNELFYTDAENIILAFRELIKALIKDNRETGLKEEYTNTLKPVDYSI